MASETYEKAITESPWAPDWLIEECQTVQAVPGTVVALVNLKKQTKTWQETVLTPDSVQAIRDRTETPPYLLRCGTITSSGFRHIKKNSHWLVHPNEGQWWSARECREVLGIEKFPDDWQLRLYNGKTNDIDDLIIIQYAD